jgi:O-antigen/teichoic acid export membrane protein
LPKSTPTIDGRGVASIARNLIYLLSGQGVYFITRFFYIIIIARVLGPQIYGMISYGIAWYLLFLPLTKMGMATVLSRDAGRSRQKGDHTATVTLALSIASIIVTTAAYIILSLFFETDPASRSIVLVFAFALIGRSLSAWTGSVYTAYECNQYSLRQEAIFRSLEIALGLVVIFIWKKALPVVAVHGFVWCCDAVYGLIIINRRVLVLRLNVKLKDMRRIFMQGFPLGVSMLLMAIPYQGPLVFFRHVASSGDVLGQLALAMQALFVLSNIPLALSGASIPVLSRSAIRRDGKDRVYAETMIRFSVLFGCSMALLGTAFAPWLTVKIFGARYAQAGNLIGPVLWLIIPFTMRQVLNSVLQAGKKDLQIFLGSLLGAIAFALTISVAAIRYNAVGAIISAAAAMSLTALYFMFLLRNYIAIDLRSALLKPGVAVVSAALVFYAMRFAGPVVSVLGSFAILLLICYWFKCLTLQEIIWLRNFFVWIRRKVSSLK